MSRSSGMSLADAQKLHETYWKLNWAVKQVAEDQIVKTLINPITQEEQMWLFNPVSKFWYSLRFMKDRFSTLVQGTASYVFDMWIKNIFEYREQLTASFHDEAVFEIRTGNREKCTNLLQHAIDKLNDEIKLDRELAISIKYGHRYSDVH